MGKGMHVHTAIPSNLLADVYESLVGAVFLDGGIEPAKDFILKYLNPEIEEVAEAAHAGNYKSLLQQVPSNAFKTTPTYHLLEQKMPAHMKCFKLSPAIRQNHYPPALRRTQKKADRMIR